MLGILLLFFIGKYYYKLAEKFKKSKLGFAILGIVVYYVGTIIFGLIFGLIAEIISPGSIDTINEKMLGLIALPFGILACYLVYKYLQKTWKKNEPITNSEINLIGKKED